MPVHNADIVEILNKVADLLDIRGMKNDVLNTRKVVELLKLLKRPQQNFAF